MFLPKNSGSPSLLQLMMLVFPKLIARNPFVLHFPRFSCGFPSNSRAISVPVAPLRTCFVATVACFLTHLTYVRPWFRLSFHSAGAVFPILPVLLFLSRFQFIFFTACLQHHVTWSVFPGLFYIQMREVSVLLTGHQFGKNHGAAPGFQF